MIKQILFLSISLSVLISASTSHAAPMKAGIGVVDITPYDFEKRPKNQDGVFFKSGHDFLDTGTDSLYDYQEVGAFGLDEKPGIAGVDDDRNGFIDDCNSPAFCKEYLFTGSDDLTDTSIDNYHEKLLATGTENDGKFQFLHLGGFRPFYPHFIGNRFAVDVHDPIWARALAVQGSNGVKMILISTDLPGLMAKHIEPVRRRIEKMLGVPKSNIVITSTHNHSGPDAAGYWSTMRDGHNKEYTDRLRDWLFESAKLAVNNMEDVKMRTITTTHYSCYNPKTLEIKKDPDCNIAPNKAAYKDQEDSGDYQYDTPIIQTDIRDPIVRNTRIVASQFTSIKTGKPVGVFINWNNHPDSIGPYNMLVTSDYVHYVREYVEKKLGGKAIYFTGTVGGQIGLAPDAIALLWNEQMEPVYLKYVKDAKGNQVREFVRSGYDRIRSVGYEIGHEVVEALKTAKNQNDQNDQEEVSLKIKSEPLDIPVDNFLHWLATKTVWQFDVEEQDKMISYEPRCDNSLGCARTDISVIQLGDLGIVTSPGETDPAYLLGRLESTSDYGFFHFDIDYPEIKGIDKFMPGKHHVILGQANNYLSYLIPTSDNVGWWNFTHPNHYEELVTVSENFGDDFGNKAMQMLGSKIRFSDRDIYPVNPKSPIKNSISGIIKKVEKASSSDEDRSLIRELLFLISPRASR